MAFQYSSQWWLIEKACTDVQYMPVKYTVEKGVAQVLSKAKCSTNYWLSENEETGMEKGSRVGSQMTARYIRMILLQAVTRKLFVPLEAYGKIIFKLKTCNCSELCCFLALLSINVMFLKGVIY